MGVSASSSIYFLPISERLPWARLLAAAVRKSSVVKSPEARAAASMVATLESWRRRSALPACCSAKSESKAVCSVESVPCRSARSFWISAATTTPRGTVIVSLRPLILTEQVNSVGVERVIR